MGLWTLILFCTTLANAAVREPANLPILMNDLDIVKQMPSPPRMDEPQAQDGKRFPRLWFGSVRWERPLNPITMDVSADLAPVSTQRFTFQVLPQLRTPDNQIRDLPEGFYVMRMVVLRPTIPGEDDDLNALAKRYPGFELYRRYVASTERLVQVTQGSIRATVEFRFHTISATTLANTLLIQILPVKAESLQRAKNGLILPNSSYELEPTANYEANVISIPFIPRFSSNLATPQTPVLTTDITDEENLDLGTFSRQAEKYVQELTRRRIEVSPSQTAIDLKLKYLTMDSREVPLDLAKALRELRQDRATLNENLAVVLCELLAKYAKVDSRYTGDLPKPQRERSAIQLRQVSATYCKGNPETHISVVQQVHAHEINKKQTLQTGGAPSRLTLAMNFATNRQQSTDTFSSYAQGFNPIDIKGIVRLGYTYTVNETNSRSKLEGTLASGGADIDIHYWDMAMTLEDYTQCTIIRAKNGKGIWPFMTEFVGFYVCDNERTTPIKMNERYYHIFPTVPSSPTLDLFDPKNQIVNIVLRSQHEYFSFIKAIRGYIRPTQSEQQNPASVLKAASQEYFNAPTIQPFTLSYGVRFVGEKVDQRNRANENPGFFERVLHKYREEF